MRRTRASWLLALSLVVAALSLVGGTPAHGQAAGSELGVSPAVGQLATTPGRTIEETVTLVNLGEAPLQIGISLEDLDVDARGRFTAISSEARQTSAVPWGFVEPQGLQLPPGNSRDIKVALTPPEGTAAGGYSAALRFSVQSRERTTETVHPVLVDVSPEKLVRSAKVSSVFIPSRSIGSTIPVTMTIENTGPLHVNARGTLIVTDATGRVTARVPIPSSIVMPGRTRILSVDVPAPLIPWRSRVRADVSFGPGVPGDSMAATGFAFSYFGIAVVAALILLIAWTITHFVRRRIRRRRALRVPATTSTPAPVEPVVRKTPAQPVARPAPEPAVRRAPTRGVAVKPSEPVEVSQPVVTKEDLDELWGPVVRKDASAARSEPFAPARSTAEKILQELADTASPEPEAAPEEAEPHDVRMIVLPQPADEPAEEPRVIRLDPEPKQARPVPEPVVAESFPQQAPMPRELPAPPIAASAGGETVPARPRLTVLPRESVVETPAAPLTPAAVDRRARVALDMLHDGAGRTGTRVEVALDVLHTVKANLTVNNKVEEAYEAARKARDRQALAPLALALAAVGSPAAPAALLRAYATAPDAIADSLLGAIRALPAEEIKANRRLITALPPERRAAVRGE